MQNKMTIEIRNWIRDMKLWRKEQELRIKENKLSIQHLESLINNYKQTILLQKGENIIINKSILHSIEQEKRERKKCR